jgi:hypothetical protein
MVATQEIWDHVFSSLKKSEYYVLLDMSLINNFPRPGATSTQTLARELAEILINKRAANSDLPITVITDPINTLYGGVVSPTLSSMIKSGINVAEVNLSPLRDSNLLASALWRPFFSWWGNTTMGGKFPHPFVSGEKVTLRSWLPLLNGKVSNTKLAVYDRPITATKDNRDHKMVTFITSADLQDAGSNNGNVALVIDDKLWQSALEGEQAVAKLSNKTIATPDTTTILDEDGPIAVTLLHEEGIKTKAIELLRASKKGDELSLALFQLSDRDIIAALHEAAMRGVKIRIILDPQKGSSRFTDSGIPNRPTAKELVQKSRGDIAIRWCDTHGEECHAKLFMGTTGTTSFLLLGSADFTRRGLDDFNIETSVLVTHEKSFTAQKDAQEFFDMLWENKGATYTASYESYEDITWWKRSASHLIEITGTASFSPLFVRAILGAS